MGLDLNKIINESISEIKNKTTDSKDDIITLTENTENTDINDNEQNINYEANLNTACLASAISAGLGAMTFRNKLSRLQEGLSDAAKQRLKTGAKVGAGLAAAGGAAYGLYRVAKGGDPTPKFALDKQEVEGRKLFGMPRNVMTAGERPNTTLLPKDVGIKRQIITDRPDTTSKFPKPSGQVSHKDIGGTLSHKDIGGTQMDQNRPTKSSLFGK